MKIKITILLFVAFCQISKSQNHIYKTFPFCNEEYKLSSFTDKYKGAKKYLYIFHFAPNACPRCEAPFNNIFNKLSDYNSAKIICVESKDYNFGKQYILTNFKGNEKSSLIDTAQYLRKYHYQTECAIYL